MTGPGRGVAIALRGVDLDYGRVGALRGIDLDVEAGGRLAVTGPSGSGKTSLLRVVAGLELPARGEVILAGVVASGPGRAVPPGDRGVAMAFQRPALWPHLSVRQNVAFGVAEPRSEAGRARVEALLDRLGLGALAHRRPHELSGGEAQRVSLARALAPSRPILLLDEPFAHLDAERAEAVTRLVAEEIAACGATLVVAVHDRDAAARLCARSVALRDGALVGST